MGARKLVKIVKSKISITDSVSRKKVYFLQQQKSVIGIVNVLGRCSKIMDDILKNWLSENAGGICCNSQKFKNLKQAQKRTFQIFQIRYGSPTLKKKSRHNMGLDVRKPVIGVSE